MRQKIAIKSSAVGLSAKVLMMFLSIISTRLFMEYLGVEIRGISSIIANILSLLQLAEMGIGTAIIYGLYQPIVDNNKEEIKSLMAFYKKAYICIGWLVFFLGSVASLFLKFFVEETSYTWSYVYLIYFIQLLASASTYWIGAYKRNLLYADQKQYIITIIDMIINTVFVLVRMWVIVYLQSYLLYLLLQLAQNVVANLFVGVAANKYFPYLKEKNVEKYEKLPELITNVKNVVISKIGGIVYNSTDNLIISKFEGVIVVGYLTNYYTIKNMFKMIASSITEPIRPMIGNYIRVYNDVERSYNLFLSYTFIRFFLANIMTVGIITMMNPFVDIWLGTEYTMTIAIPVLMAIDMFISIVHGPTGEFIDVLGLFKHDRNMSIIATSINLITSIALVLAMGAPGVLLGTVIAQCYYWVARAHIVFSQYFKQGRLQYIIQVIAFCIVTTVDVFLMLFIREQLMPQTTLGKFVLLCFICLAVSFGSICLIWCRSKEFHFMLNMLQLFIKGKKGKTSDEV